MGFSSLDNFTSAITTSGQFSRTDFYKLSTTTAATAGRCYDMQTWSGFPTAQTFAGTNLSFVAMSDTNGFGIPHGGNVSTMTKHLVNFGVCSTVATAVPSFVYLYDCLGYYPVTTTTTITAQTLNNTVTLPRYTSGAGVRAFVVCTALCGAGTPNITISYTNQAGVSGRTMPVTVTAVATAIQGHIIHSDPSAAKFFPFLPLQAGDTGIQSIQTVTLSATMTSGTIAIVLCKPICSIPMTTAGVAAERNLMTQLPSLPRVYDGANLNTLLFTGAATAASTPIMGYIETAWN